MGMETLMTNTKRLRLADAIIEKRFDSIARGGTLPKKDAALIRDAVQLSRFDLEQAVKAARARRST